LSITERLRLNAKLLVSNQSFGTGNAAPARGEESRFTDAVAAGVEHFVKHTEIAEVLQALGRDEFTAEFFAREVLALDEGSLEAVLREAYRET
jgi:hypothetical protein